MTEKQPGRPPIPDKKKKKVRSIRITDDDHDKIISEFGSIQLWVDLMLGKEKEG